MVYGFILVFFSNFVHKMHRFWVIRHVSRQWPWNPGWGSLKVIGNYTIQSGTHDLLLTFHSHHRPISHRFRGKRRYPSKIANFPTPVYLRPPLKGFPLELCIGAGVSETGMMGLSGGCKSLQISLADLIQYRSVTATQPSTQRARHVAVASTALTRR